LKLDCQSQSSSPRSTLAKRPTSIKPRRLISIPPSHSSATRVLTYMTPAYSPSGRGVTSGAYQIDAGRSLSIEAGTEQVVAGTGTPIGLGNVAVGVATVGAIGVATVGVVGVATVGVVGVATVGVVGVTCLLSVDTAVAKVFKVEVVVLIQSFGK
jgi:hypothetical protein